jgi:hypothetical protein
MYYPHYGDDHAYGPEIGTYSTPYCVVFGMVEVFNLATIICAMLLFEIDGDADCSEMSDMRAYVKVVFCAKVFWIVTRDYNETTAHDIGGPQRMRLAIYYVLVFVSIVYGCIILPESVAAFQTLEDCGYSNWFTFVAATLFANIPVLCCVIICQNRKTPCTFDSDRRRVEQRLGPMALRGLPPRVALSSNHVTLGIIQDLPYAGRIP